MNYNAARDFDEAKKLVSKRHYAQALPILQQLNYSYPGHREIKKYLDKCLAHAPATRQYNYRPGVARTPQRQTGINKVPIWGWIVGGIIILAIIGSASKSSTGQTQPSPNATVQAVALAAKSEPATATPKPTATVKPNATAKPNPTIQATNTVAPATTQVAVKPNSVNSAPTTAPSPTSTIAPSPSATPVPFDQADPNCIDLAALRDRPFKVGDTVCVEGVIGTVGSFYLLFYGTEKNFLASDVSNILDISITPAFTNKSGPRDFLMYKDRRVRVTGQLTKGISPVLWSLILTEPAQLQIVTLSNDAKATAVALSGASPLTPTPVPIVLPTPTPKPIPASNPGGSSSSGEGGSSSSGGGSSGSSGVRTGAICKDGSPSNATGSGACSHHGGVDHWLYK